MQKMFWESLVLVAVFSGSGVCFGSEVVGKPFAFKDPFGLAVNSRDVVYVAEIKGGAGQ